MKYALERIDNIVLRTLHPSKITATNPTVNEIKEIYTFAAAEHDHIIDQLKNEFFSIQKEKQLELFVQRYQSSIIHLADILVQYIEGTKESKIQKLYKVLLVLLERLLSFIEDFFSRYFDLDAKIPESYRILSNKEFQAAFALIKTKAKHFSSYPALLEIIIESYEIFALRNPQRPITFRRLIYHKKLLSAIFKIMVQKKDTTQEEELINLLQYFNFNNNRFVYILTAKISMVVNEILSPAAKLENLYWQVKFFSQLHTKPQFSLNPNLPVLKEICVHWLQEEIYFIEKKAQPTFILPQLPVKEITQIETSLSVPQLAFIIKILIEKGIIKNQSCRNLTQMTALYFKTKNTEIISPESLRLKAYAPDRAAVSKVKDTLLELLNHINTKFKIHFLIPMLSYAFEESQLFLLSGAAESLAMA